MGRWGGVSVCGWGLGVGGGWVWESVGGCECVCQWVGGWDGG